MPVTINTVVADLQKALADAQALVPVDDAQQNSPVPAADWLEGTPATLDVLGHFSSPSGQPLHLALAAGAVLPAGVTLSGGSLAYDGTGSFRTAVNVGLTVTAG